MAKIKIDDALYDRAARAAAAAGYSSAEELIAHCLEQELARLAGDDSEQQVTDQLRGLGYLE